MSQSNRTSSIILAALTTAVLALSMSAVAGHGPASKRNSVKAGAELFQKNCMGCHGANAAGGKFAPKLAGTKMSEKKFVTVVTNGKDRKMPKFGGKLKPAEIKSIYAYVKSLK